MELGETDFNKLLYERQGTAISIPWITLYFKQVSKVETSSLAKITERFL
jgi:hypothetical protein